MMRRGIIGAAAVLLSALLTTSARAQEVTLKLHQFLPPPATVPKLFFFQAEDGIRDPYP